MCRRCVQGSSRRAGAACQVAGCSLRGPVRQDKHYEPFQKAAHQALAEFEPFVNAMADVVLFSDEAVRVLLDVGATAAELQVRARAEAVRFASKRGRHLTSWRVRSLPRTQC